MGYLSWKFVVFVLSLLLLYRVVPQKVSSGKRMILLLGSLYFYCSFGISCLPFLLFASVSTYFGARLTEKAKRKRLILAITVILNVALLFTVKVLPWLMQFIGHYIESLPPLRFSSLLVPIGISYFELQAIGYLVDVYRGKIKAERDFLNILLFLSYFPAIVQGPISRYDVLMPQLLEKKSFSDHGFQHSFLLILFGLVKKLVIADRLGVFVDSCFDNYAEYEGIILYLGAVGYAIQIYADFSGCVDICRGISMLFDVELEDNFRRPYRSASIKEFWSRWHISLSKWLKDYVYIPLGGNRKGKARQYWNILITFFVSAVWHGAGFSFFVWGFLHAAYQIFEDLLKPGGRKLKSLLAIKDNSFLERFIRVFTTFHLVTFSWVFFRAASLKNGIEYCKRMFSRFNAAPLFNGGLFLCGLDRQGFSFLLVNILILFFVDRKTGDQSEAADMVLREHLLVRWAVFFLLLLDVILIGAYGDGYSLSGFMYGGF